MALWTSVWSILSMYVGIIGSGVAHAIFIPETEIGIAASKGR